MTPAHRINALTHLALTYNREKHANMPKLIARRMSDTESRIPVLQTKLEDLLRQHEVHHSEISTQVSELRALSAFLASRNTASLGDGLESVIGLVRDRIQNKCSIATSAASSKMRKKLRSRL